MNQLTSKYYFQSYILNNVYMSYCTYILQTKEKTRDQR